MMTDAQFSALMALTATRNSRASLAARMVLVGGTSQAHAARYHGITKAAVCVAVRRVRRVQALVLRALPGQV